MTLPRRDNLTPVPYFVYYVKFPRTEKSRITVRPPANISKRQFVYFLPFPPLRQFSGLFLFLIARELTLSACIVSTVY